MTKLKHQYCADCGTDITSRPDACTCPERATESNDSDQPEQDEIDGAKILDELRTVLQKYVILPSPEALNAVTLWIAATHAQPAWQTATRLVITAPEKRCGKSRLLDIIEATCHKPLMAVNISPAALVRSIGKDPPSLLLDEADTYFGKKSADNHEDLRGILNAGHQRNRPYIRWDASARTTENCPTFAMAALAGIGSMPDTIEDRAVMVRMRRRGHGESVRPYRNRRDSPPLAALRKQITAWIRPRLDLLQEAEPDMPVEDRAADNWESLIAVADLAGGDWPGLARDACRVLTSASSEDTSVGVRLLKDLREILEDAEALHGTTILDRLHKMEEAPWADWYGHPLNPRDLAKLLKPYGVVSIDVKLDGINRKGYRREHLYDAWNRYLPAIEGESATSATDATAQVRGTPPVAGSGQQALPATEDPALTSGVARVAEVADTPAVFAASIPHTASGSRLSTCAGCGQPLRVFTPGQTTHPTPECEAKAR